MVVIHLTQRGYPGFVDSYEIPHRDPLSLLDWLSLPNVNLYLAYQTDYSLLTSESVQA